MKILKVKGKEKVRSYSYTLFMLALMYRGVWREMNYFVFY